MKQVTNEYLCWDCNYPIKKNQKTCKHCWAELVWEKNKRKTWLYLWLWAIVLLWIIWIINRTWLLWIILVLIALTPLVRFIYMIIRWIKNTNKKTLLVYISFWIWTILTIGLLVLLLSNINLILNRIIIGLYIGLHILKRPLIIIWWLAIIYWIVKFIKRSRNN